MSKPTAEVPGVPPAEILTKRRALVMREARRAHGVDSLLVTNPPDIRYLCGSTEGGSALLIAKRSAFLYTSNMFRVRATRESPGTEIRIPSIPMEEDVRDICRRKHCSDLGFQDGVMSFSRHEQIHKTLGEACTLHPIGDLIVRLRAVKDIHEITWTREAIRIAEEAFLDLLRGGAEFFIGRTERQLAAELDYRMMLRGADRNGFPGGTIVASGPNSYFCHHMPGDRVVRDGDPVLFDWGAELHGYRSDITRVVFVRSVPEPLRRIYDIVLEAHDAAVELMAPRVRCHTIDAAAREVIRRAGYAKEFRHGLGHGVGLEIHEFPRLAGKPKTGPGTPLKPGMIITVEPGVYLQEIGGVRIEDDILVTKNGYERLNRLSRSLDEAILA